MASPAIGLAHDDAVKAISASDSPESTNSGKTSDSIDEKISADNTDTALMPVNQSSVIEKETAIKTSGDSESEETGSYEEDEDEDEEEEELPRAGIRDLFRYANRNDMLLNAIGMLTACAAGAAQVSLPRRLISRSMLI